MANTASPLGKGLSALLTSTDPQTISDAHIKNAYLPAIDVGLIEKNPYQPRLNAEEHIDNLVESIKEQGLISPLIVTKLPNGNYQLIAGERRLTAIRKIGLKTVPVIVKEAAGEKLLEVALIENIQRRDLNPLEEATAYRQLQNEFHMPVEKIAKEVGFSVQVVSEKLTLLELPNFAQEALLNGNINYGQALELLPLLPDPDNMQVALQVCIKNQLSIKQLHSLVDKLAAGLSLERAKKIRDDKTRDMEIAFTKLIGRKIYFTRTHKGGKIIISFNNDDELDELYKRFSYIGYHI